MFALSPAPLDLAHPLAGSPSTAGLLPLLSACGLGWFCLRGAGRREHLAALNLARRADVEAFAPRIRVRRECRSGGVAMATEALFPGYLFARFRYPEQLRRVVSTHGVLGLVSFGGPPPQLDDSTIAHLRRHAEPAAPVATISPVFGPGDWVRIAGGCFRGSEGRIRELEAGHDRVCVLLSLLGHDVEISLPAGQLIGRSELPQLVPLALRSGGAMLSVGGV